MLTEQQTKMTDFLLKYLSSHGGKSSIDDYPQALELQGFDRFESPSLIQTLINHYNFIEYIGNSTRFIMLTPEGNKASKIGLTKYFDEKDELNNLEKESKKTSIKGVKNANRNSIISIVIASLALLCSAILVYLKLSENNFKNHENQNINQTENRDYKCDTTKPFCMNNTISFEILIDSIKKSLKHDTLFFNEVKQIENKNKTKP